jgi:hypothetical protein
MVTPPPTDQPVTGLPEGLQLDPLPEPPEEGFVYGGPVSDVRRGWSLPMRLPFGAYLPSRGALALVALALGAWWVASRWEREIPLRTDDRGLVLTAAHVQALTGGFEVLPAAERLVRTDSLLGTQRVEYTYAKTARDQPQLRFVFETRASEGHARDAFTWSSVETMTDWKLAGEEQVGLVELDEGITWGSESRAFLVEVNGRPAGNSFAARLGRTTVYLELRGVWVADPWAFGRLLQPVLSAIAAEPH